MYNQYLIDFDKFFNVNTEKIKNKNESYIDSIIYSDVRSEQFKKMIEELITVSDDFTLSILEHKNRVNQLNKLAFSTLDEEELGYFLADSSTACASFEYWHNHLQEWVELFKAESTQQLTKSNSNWWLPATGGISEGMTGADIGGAVSEAIVGAITGPGAGISAVAGGVAASTGKVDENIFNYLF